MKKVLLPTFAVIIILTVLFSLTAGCKNDGEVEYDPSDFIYVPQFITLPDEIREISGLVYLNEKLYIASNGMIDEDKFIYSPGLFIMDLDGTGFTEADGYSPQTPDMVNTVLSVEINALNTDGDGNLWVYESGRLYTYEDYEYIDDTHFLRKLDTTGSEIFSIDLNILFDDIDPHAWFYVVSFIFDTSGNIFLDVAKSGTRIIYVLDSDGMMLFELDFPAWDSQFAIMPDGTVAIFILGDGHNKILQPVDYEARTWGDAVELPVNAYNIHHGGGNFDFISSDSSSLSGIVLEPLETVTLLNWVDSDVMTEGLDNITVLPDGRIICTNSSVDFVNWETTYELIILTKTPSSEIPERTVLTLAAFALDHRLNSAVVRFNRANPSYRIQVIDYLDFRTDEDWFAGMTMFSVEIMSGKLPDMIVAEHLPFMQMVTRGFIEDLNPYIDGDREFKRSDFVESALKTSELDGKLFRIFPGFYVNTITGHPSVTGPGTGWDMDGFMAVLDANPQADVPLGAWLVKESFLVSSVLLNIDEFVDWTAGTVNFDNGSFAGLLEIADTFPFEIDWGEFGTVTSPMTEDLIAEGRQIMINYPVFDFNAFLNYRRIFGGEIVFKGMPTGTGSGNTMTVMLELAMTTECKDKAGAWEFMRTLLTKEWQLSNITEFPVNKAAFDEKAEAAMTALETPAWWSPDMGIFPGLFPLTHTELGQINRLIDSMSGVAYLDDGLMTIIMEDASDFFNGRHATARETARVIQSRAQIFIAEQLG